jgi:poly(3-hydroxyalkanoate) synthetase
VPALSGPLLWPLVAAATASDAAAKCFSDIAHALIGKGTVREGQPPRWSTPHRIALELPTLWLRDFSTGADGAPTLVCAPFALHGSSVADFAPGHSLIGTLRRAGLRRLYATDWRSATPDMRLLSIDDYLAALNIAVDELGPPVNLIGLCQGGWMALVYAARFPGKVRRLVIAGAPIDLRAGESVLSRLAAETPLSVFEELVRLGDGRVLGQRVLEFWRNALTVADVHDVLQVQPRGDDDALRDLERRFADWNAWTVNLPGTYYLQVVSWLFKENRIAEGRFMALGHTVDLAALDVPMFLLAARDDELVAPEQLFAAARLVATPARDIEMATEPCRHLGLFMGAQTLQRAWPPIVRWLNRRPADIHRPSDLLPAPACA